MQASGGPKDHAPLILPMLVITSWKCDPSDSAQRAQYQCCCHVLGIGEGFATSFSPVLTRSRLFARFVSPVEHNWSKWSRCPALSLNPVTAAVCTVDQICGMCEALRRAQGQWLEPWPHARQQCAEEIRRSPPHGRIPGWPLGLQGGMSSNRTGASLRRQPVQPTRTTSDRALTAAVPQHACPLFLPETWLRGGHGPGPRSRCPGRAGQEPHG